MLMELNSIYFDVAVIVILLAIIAIGALKGVMHTSINLLMLVGSIALAFSPLLDVVKTPLINLLVEKVSLGAGSAQEAKLGLLLAYRMLVSVGLAVAMYIVLRLIKGIVIHVIKRRAKKSNRLLKSPHTLSRVSGALVSLLFNGVVVVALLSIFASPMIGGNKTLEKSAVAKHVEKTDDLVVGLFVDDVELLENKVLVKLVKGNLFAKVSNETGKDMIAVANLVNEGKLIPTDLNNPQEKVDSLEHVLALVKAIEPEEFKDATEIMKDLVAKAVNAMKTIHDESGSGLIEVKGGMAVHKLLVEFDLQTSADAFAEIFTME